MEERIDDLEIRIAFLERALETLDSVVREMTGQIQSLREELRQARDAQQDAPVATITTDPLDEVPPHY